jgi:hypothetical protein
MYLQGDQASLHPATWAALGKSRRLRDAFYRALDDAERGGERLRIVVLDADRFGRERREELARLRRLGVDVGLLESTQRDLEHLLGQFATVDRASPEQLGDLTRRYGELTAEVEQVRVSLTNLEGMLELARAGLAHHLDPAKSRS